MTSATESVSITIYRWMISTYILEEKRIKYVSAHTFRILCSMPFVHNLYGDTTVVNIIPI